MTDEPDWERKRQLGWDESTPPDVRADLLTDSDPRVRAAAAQHATAEQLRVLATDPRAEVRLAVGANAKTPSDVLMALTEDRSANVRWWMVDGGWWMVAGAQAQRNKGVLRRLQDDDGRTVADTAGTAIDGLRLYRRILNLPGSGLASLANRLIERRQRA